MKKSLIIIAAFCVLLKAENIQQDSEKNVEERLVAEPRVPNDAGIKKMIEDKREELVAKGYNDIPLNDYVLSIDNDALGTQGQLRVTGVIHGLVGFVVKKFSGALFYNFDVEWPEIDIRIDPYDLEGYVHLIRVFGTGSLHVNIKELGIFGRIGLFPDPGKPPSSVYIKSIKINVRLEKEQDEKWFSLTGWLNDSVRSEVISALVRENLQPMLEEYQPEISAFLAKTIMDLDLHIPF